MGCKPNWTREEIEYLSENWGSKAIPKIAGELDRSVNAVKLKAQKLRLGAWLDAGDYVSLNQLMKALGRDYGLQYTAKIWIDELGLPVTRKRVNRSYFKVVKLDKFWAWAETNQSRIDLSLLPEGLLGKEPEWAKTKRKNDSIRSRLVKKTVAKKRWTEHEDQLLISLLKSYKYTTDQIAERLGRSEGAVARRVISIGTKYRPLRNSPHTPWTRSEIQLLQRIIAEGGNYEAIRSKIPMHSTKAIRGMVFRLYNTEKLDKVRSDGLWQNT